MTNLETQSPVVEFLVRLKRIDRKGYTVRDVLSLYTIIHNPGISGVDLAGMIGAGNRSNINSNIHRLIRAGLIEDRRATTRKANPAVLHALPAGIEFWNEIKP